MTAVPQLIGDVSVGENQFSVVNLQYLKPGWVLLCLKPPGIDI
jgi:hypothetical protein